MKMDSNIRQDLILIHHPVKRRHQQKRGRKSNAGTQQHTDPEHPEATGNLKIRISQCLQDTQFFSMAVNIMLNIKK